MEHGVFGAGPVKYGQDWGFVQFHGAGFWFLFSGEGAYLKCIERI